MGRHKNRTDVVVAEIRKFFRGNYGSYTVRQIARQIRRDYNPTLVALARMRADGEVFRARSRHQRNRYVYWFGKVDVRVCMECDREYDHSAEEITWDYSTCYSCNEWNLARELEDRP